MDSVNCPLCGTKNEISDIWELGTECDYECHECCETFLLKIEYEPLLSASKIHYDLCGSCEKEVRNVTSTGIFPIDIPENLKGKKVCDECGRKIMGYA